MNKLQITKNGIVTTLDKSDLISIDETYDGVCFNFKNGLHLHLTDTDMPTGTKNLIHTATAYNVPLLKIDLNNYKQPLKIDIP